MCYCNLFYSNIIPRRSYLKSFIRFKPKINNIKEKIVYLQNLYQPEQRSLDWYSYRHNLLTASNIWKCFMSQATQNQLIYEKCQPFKQYSHNISTNSPLHWGQKYEPLSILYYEYYYKTKVADFGCIKHPKYEYIGASPDGINIKEDSLLYGRMLEIKNIVNREINGIPKLEYWIQMQLQMETCNLNECDFLETKFVEYKNEDEYLNDKDKLKGKILYFSKNSESYYEYIPFYLNDQETIEYEKKIFEKNKDLIFINTIYWKLEKISCVLVLRNKFWFKQALPYITNIWNTIQNEKNGNYQHRAPKKRQKNIQVVKQECLIDMSKII